MWVHIDTMLRFVEAVQCGTWQVEARKRLQSAFRPKTRQAYQCFLRVFIASCVCIKVSIYHFSVIKVLAFLEYLVHNDVSVPMLVSYLSALKSLAIMFYLPHRPFVHPQVNYYIKTLKSDRSLVVSAKNVIDINTLIGIIRLCDSLANADTLKPIFLTGIFRFFRLSNLTPDVVGDFDPTRHFTGEMSFLPMGLLNYF